LKVRRFQKDKNRDQKNITEQAGAAKRMENGSCNIDIHSHVRYGVSYKYWLVSHEHLGCQQQIRFSESSSYLSFYN